MEKKHLILISAGIILAVIILGRKKVPEPFSVIKPGDKGNDVYGLQAAITNITGLKFTEMGAYDNETLNAVRYYLKDSYALFDYEKGYVDKKFASDLWLLQSKVTKL